MFGTNASTGEQHKNTVGLTHRSEDGMETEEEKPVLKYTEGDNETQMKLTYFSK